LLFAQLPLALGTAVALRELAAIRVRAVIGCTLAASAVFALATLKFTGPDITYFGSSLQASYGVSSIIPTGSRVVVASDPQTEYYLLTTGDRVLTESEWHAGSPAEAAIARRGYSLMHELFWRRNWREAARRMYREGVRYVVVNPKVTLSRATLRQFSGLRPPLPRTKGDRLALRRYYRRLSAIGTHAGNSYEIAVYRFDRKRLFR
jgi:hypothetical protein